jgi:hypothetical protein
MCHHLCFNICRLKSDIICTEVLYFFGVPVPVAGAKPLILGFWIECSATVLPGTTNQNHYLNLALILCQSWHIPTVIWRSWWFNKILGNTKTRQYVVPKSKQNVSKLAEASAVQGARKLTGDNQKSCLGWIFNSKLVCFCYKCNCLA